MFEFLLVFLACVNRCQPHRWFPLAIEHQCFTLKAWAQSPFFPPTEKAIMNDIKKDHSVGAGTGAVAGAVAGASIGAAGGPLGSVVGAVAGGIAGSKAGDYIAEAVNPTEYELQMERSYTTKPYYSADYGWDDYQPAYQYGYQTYPRYQGRRFEDVEPDLAREWNEVKGDSRLAWEDAKAAVRDGWHTIERALPGDFDRDGR